MLEARCGRAAAMKYSLDRCCGGPVINRAPLLIQKNPLTGVAKESLTEKSEQDETKAFWTELTDSFRD